MAPFLNSFLISCDLKQPFRRHTAARRCQSSAAQPPAAASFFASQRSATRCSRSSARSALNRSPRRATLRLGLAASSVARKRRLRRTQSMPTTLQHRPRSLSRPPRLPLRRKLRRPRRPCWCLGQGASRMGGGGPWSPAATVTSMPMAIRLPRFLSCDRRRHRRRLRRRRGCRQNASRSRPRCRLLLAVSLPFGRLARLSPLGWSRRDGAAGSSSLTIATRATARTCRPTGGGRPDPQPLLDRTRRA